MLLFATSNDSEKFIPVFQEAAKFFKGKVYFMQQILNFISYELFKFYKYPIGVCLTMINNPAPKFF